MNMDMEQARFNMIEQQIRPGGAGSGRARPAVRSEARGVRAVEQKLLAFADVCLPLGSSAMRWSRMEARLLQELGLKGTDRVLRDRNRQPAIWRLCWQRAPSS